MKPNKLYQYFLTEIQQVHKFYIKYLPQIFYAFFIIFASLFLLISEGILKLPRQESIPLVVAVAYRPSQASYLPAPFPYLLPAGRNKGHEHQCGVYAKNWERNNYNIVKSFSCSSTTTDLIMLILFYTWTVKVAQYYTTSYFVRYPLGCGYLDMWNGFCLTNTSMVEYFLLYTCTRILNTLGLSCCNLRN